MAVVANPLVVRIFINSTLTGRENGWAERWPIWETNWNFALPIALQMVQARQRVLSSNAYIQWACLGSVTPPYYEQTVVTDPLYPLPQWGPAAFDMQGVLFDLNNAAGENAPRLFRAVDRDEINAKTWRYADMPIPFTPPALPADLTTAPKDLLWQNTLATFRQYASTQQPMSDGHHGPGNGYWVAAYDQIVYRQVGSRRWGRSWKRMSWEAAPFVNAPQFSPCGCVVTVNRISYAIQCRFGPAWSLRWIHYYEAGLGAEVMTFRTPFCCWNRSLEYTDFSGVGEAKKYQRRNWTNGSEWGAAPGVMWTGPQSYFEGFAPEPPIPTPGFMRPACDAPVAPPAQIALGGAGGGGVGITCAFGRSVPSPVPDRDQRGVAMLLRKRRFRQLPGGTRPHVDGPFPTPPPMMAHWVESRFDPFRTDWPRPGARGVPRIPMGGSEHGVVSESSPGTYTWTAPLNVLAVYVYATGPGGAGAAGDVLLFGGGGGGGGLGTGLLAVTPGGTYSYIVGAPGTDSSFTGDVATITGQAGFDAVGATGGARGGSNGGAGGDGGNSPTFAGGGGGGSAGELGSGGAGAAGVIGGAGGAGGSGILSPGAAGGAGGSAASTGAPGVSPGGGGGGGGNGGVNAGGTGANGRIIFYW